ncbi:hypothetical protein FQR65_LT17332 [Abscondita terminalis]|nr:hypothetical protein FQR65_LT17332 [Abscondita terminalis]
MRPSEKGSLVLFAYSYYCSFPMLIQSLRFKALSLWFAENSSLGEIISENNEYNKVKGYDNIFAIGDIAYMETAEYPQGHAQLASVAIAQGEQLGKNLFKKQAWEPFKYKDKGSMATIGTSSLL